MQSVSVWLMFSDFIFCNCILNTELCKLLWRRKDNQRRSRAPLLSWWFLQVINSFETMCNVQYLATLLRKRRHPLRSAIQNLRRFSLSCPPHSEARQGGNNVNSVASSQHSCSTDQFYCRPGPRLLRRQIVCLAWSMEPGQALLGITGQCLPVTRELLRINCSLKYRVNTRIN